MPATKEQIAQTFIELAFRFGYRRTTVEDVARALQISKKTIYEHFSSKQQLLEFALEMAATGQRQRVEAMLTEPTALGRLLEVVSLALADVRSFYVSGPHVEMVEPPELQQEVNARVFAPMILSLLEEGVAAGEFDIAEPEVTATLCFAMGMEAARMIQRDPECRPEAAVREALRRIATGSGEGSFEAGPEEQGETRPGV